ncbi:MAG: ribbon-helix-helix protein, CopG family [Chitinivibrionales bacterium]|nr:ribbon-helix-helix protein, CopG family [Chitinivibrionales bacterium]MBD3394746.1 ribbon-helix-helix protein, CopG family [Chitinivibrionales bacterium]
MSVAKIAITLEEGLLHKIDRLVRRRVYPNRSKAIQDAVAERMQKYDRNRLARECAKLSKSHEQKLADEGMGTGEWPEY